MSNVAHCMYTDLLFTEAGEVISRVCVVRVESINPPCLDQAAQDRDSPPLPSGDDKSTFEHVLVKQEKPEEEGVDSACGLDSIKMEDFSPECMSAVQSKMLDEWKPEVLDIQSQDSNAPLSCSRLAQGKKPQNVCFYSKGYMGLAFQFGNILHYVNI